MPRRTRSCPAARRSTTARRSGRTTPQTGSWRCACSCRPTRRRPLDDAAHRRRRSRRHRRPRPLRLDSQRRSDAVVEGSRCHVPRLVPQLLADARRRAAGRRRAQRRGGPRGGRRRRLPVGCRASSFPASSRRCRGSRSSGSSCSAPSTCTASWATASRARCSPTSRSTGRSICSVSSRSSASSR